MRRRWGTALVLVLVVAAALGFAFTRREHPASAVTVQIGARSVQVPTGSTLGAAIDAYALRPRGGRLLDVQGHVLRPDAYPGSIRVNGRAVPAGTRLADGDRIDVVDGRDRTEAVTRSVVRLKNGMQADPEYTIARAPGVDVVVRGAVSHELVSSRFRATGAARPQRAVALTFDDGPSPEYTPRVLAALRRLHVHATFFVIGYLARAYPDLVRHEHRAGMAIGNHTYNHPEVPPFGQLPQPLVRDEISLTAQILARLGIETDLFRPPGGSTSALVERTASSFGERVILWSVDPADWVVGTTAKQIAHRVLAAVRPGSIVILHDGGGDRSATVAALRPIVRGIRRRGLAIVTLDELKSS